MKDFLEYSEELLAAQRNERPDADVTASKIQTGARLYRANEPIPEDQYSTGSSGPTPAEQSEYRFVSEFEKGDEINPSYYSTGYPVEVIEIAERLNFLLGNVVKYVLRAGQKTKDPLTDLKKAQWYLSREIENLEQWGLENNGDN